MFNPRHQNDRQAAIARQAAETLFTPKPDQRARSHKPAEALARKPRILAALPPVRPDMATAEMPKPEKRRAIPKSKIDSIRTWLRYGMTVGQAADVYDVSVTDIKHALRDAVIAAPSDE